MNTKTNYYNIPEHVITLSQKMHGRTIDEVLNTWLQQSTQSFMKSEHKRTKNEATLEWEVLILTMRCEALSNQLLERMEKDNDLPQI